MTHDKQTQTQTQNTQTQQTKTIQQQPQHISGAIGATGLAFGLATSLALIGYGIYKWYSSKKGRTFIKNLINDIDNEIINLKEDLTNKKQDVFLNSALTDDDKRKQLKDIQADYLREYDKLKTKKDDLKLKLKGK